MVPPSQKALLPRIIHLLGERPIIVAPLVLADETIGAINVTATWLRPVDAAMVAALADHIAIALGHVRSRFEMAQSLRRERLRSEIVEALVGSLNLPKALDRALALTIEAADADAAALAIYDPDGDCLRYTHIIGLPEEMRSSLQPRGRGLVWQVMERQEPLLVDDYEQIPEAMPNGSASGCMP